MKKFQARIIYGIDKDREGCICIYDKEIQEFIGRPVFYCYGLTRENIEVQKEWENVIIRLNRYLEDVKRPKDNDYQYKIIWAESFFELAESKGYSLTEATDILSYSQYNDIYLSPESYLRKFREESDMRTFKRNLEKRIEIIDNKIHDGQL